MPPPPTRAAAQAAVQLHRVVLRALRRIDTALEPLARVDAAATAAAPAGPRPSALPDPDFAVFWRPLAEGFPGADAAAGLPGLREAVRQRLREGADPAPVWKLLRRAKSAAREAEELRAAAEGSMHSVTERWSGSIAGALWADAVCLPSHYQYDRSRIATAASTAATAGAEPPGPDAAWTLSLGVKRWHGSKDKGEQTDYGDSVIWAAGVAERHLRWRAASGPGGAGISLPFDDLAADWEAWATTYGGYRCQSLVATLQHREWGLPPEHAACHVRDLTCLPRIPPLLTLASNEEEAVAFAEGAARITHEHHDSVVCATVFARALWRCITAGGALGRRRLAASLVSAADASRAGALPDLLRAAVREALNDAEDAEERAPDPAAETEAAMQRFYGQMGASPDLWAEHLLALQSSDAFPSFAAAAYFAVRHAPSLRQAAWANACFGGDNAARGIVIGALVGAAGSGSLTDAHRAQLSAEALGALQGLRAAAEAASPPGEFTVAPPPAAVTPLPAVHAGRCTAITNGVEVGCRARLLEQPPVAGGGWHAEVEILVAHADANRLQVAGRYYVLSFEDGQVFPLTRELRPDEAIPLGPRGRRRGWRFRFTTRTRPAEVCGGVVLSATESSGAVRRQWVAKMPRTLFAPESVWRVAETEEAPRADAEVDFIGDFDMRGAV